jgi:hypothetical protein
MRVSERNTIRKLSFVPITILLTFLCCLVSSQSVQADDHTQYLQQLKSKDPSVRMEAARILGEMKELSAIDPLISLLKEDKDWGVRGAAEDALVNIGRPSVERLIAMLKDNEWRIRRRAARTLGAIKDPRAVEPLGATLNSDKDCCVKKFSAKALGETDDIRATEILLNAFKNGNLEVVTGAYRFFIRRGEAGSEPMLIEALNGAWDRTMAINFQNCGNPQLEQAASDWAKRRGYTLTLAADQTVPKWGEALK